jgi:hypothetical protein
MKKKGVSKMKFASFLILVTIFYFTLDHTSVAPSFQRQINEKISSIVKTTSSYGRWDYNSVKNLLPTAECRDGWISYSNSRRGTCSHHGGVAIWLKKF